MRSTIPATIIFLFVFSHAALSAQDCLPEGILFSSQAQIDAFALNYPECSTILGDVTIEEEMAKTITNLNGLAGITAFGGGLEIHDNAALTNLKGLQNVLLIGGGLNIYGNPGLEELNGLESLTAISGSLRIAYNHRLRSITALSQLQTIAEDLTVTDNLLLPSLHGLEKVDTIGGYFVVLSSHELLNLRGLDALRSIGKGMLIEDNSQLRDLRGLDKLTSVGGNCIIVNNKDLRTLGGLNALASVGGKLQIALNPFLEEVTALKNLQRIKGLLQIYANTRLKSLSGLENIDAAGIEDLAILSSDILSNCSVRSICDYLEEGSNQASIAMNGTGCNIRAQILERCQRQGPTGRPNKPADPVFFPNPTGGLVTVKAEDLESARYEVADALGRILLEGELKQQQFDLSELTAGIYFVKIRTEEIELLRKIIKLN